MSGRKQSIFIGPGIFQLDPAATGKEIPLITVKLGDKGSMVGQHRFNFIRSVWIIIFPFDLRILTCRKKKEETDSNYNHTQPVKIIHTNICTIFHHKDILITIAPESRGTFQLWIFHISAGEFCDAALKALLSVQQANCDRLVTSQ